MQSLALVTPGVHINDGGKVRLEVLLSAGAFQGFVAIIILLCTQETSKFSMESK